MSTKTEGQLQADKELEEARQEVLKQKAAWREAVRKLQQKRRELAIANDRLQEHEQKRKREEVKGCTICTEKYMPNRVPKVLACSHNICSDCYQKFYNQAHVVNSNFEILCPTCRKPTKHPCSKSVRAARNNQKMIEFLQF